MQWEHGPHLVEHPPEGEAWRGFPAAGELAPGLVLVPLPGHSRGHAAVAVDAGSHWVLHAGDACDHHGTLDGTRVPAVRVMEAAIAHDRRRVAENHERLAELARESPGDLLVVRAHDPALLDAARRRQDRTA